MVRIIENHDYMPAAKAVMGLVGLDCGPVRPPLKALSADTIGRLKRDLEAIGFFDWATY